MPEKIEESDESCHEISFLELKYASNLPEFTENTEI